MNNMNRRSFIKQVSALGGAAAVASLGFPGIVTGKHQRKVGVALAGLGYYSTDELAPALQLTEHCELRGIVTGSPWKIPVWQEKYGIPDKNVYNYENLYTIADNPDIDVVYIVLPNSLHMKYSVIAAEAGKHVWCEKPMALTVDECEKIIGACEKNRVKLTIGYRMQHEPNTREIIRFREENRYGTIRSVEASAGYYSRIARREDSWKLQSAMGGGATYDMGVYPINAARYVTGEEPVSVSARLESNRSQFDEVDETAWYELTFPGGARASLMTSMGENINRLHVDTRDGWYGLQPFSTYSGISGETSDGVILNKRIPNQQALQMDNDARAILENSDVIVPGMDGLEDIRVVEAIFKAADSGEEVRI
ncbi:Gfo/Idh/MocA family oxidoreductase [Balneolaceae bacterium ANBcel3]|nr:Gfo/Idh/MocA family oxidoreductase [Balneolaceae bacterium ANBcel3]